MVKCSLHDGNHDLAYRNSFLQFDIQERSKWLFLNKLCYGCLSAINVNHNARNCKNKKECKVYKKIHPTSLHGYKEVKSKVKEPDVNSSDQLKVNVNCAAANTKSDVISMYVVPMLARHRLSNCIVKTYTMLDEGIQATFKKNELLEI